MKKVRVNLQERFPKYFAVTERTEAFAEISEDELARVQKVENALASVADEEEEEEENKKSASKKANSSTCKCGKSEDEDDEKAEKDDEDDEYAALLDKISKLESKIEKLPAAAATSVTTDETQEGGGKKKEYAYATSVDEELDRILGVK